MELTTKMTHGARGVKMTFCPNKQWLNPAWWSSNRDAEMLSHSAGDPWHPQSLPENSSIAAFMCYVEQLVEVKHDQAIMLIWVTMSLLLSLRRGGIPEWQSKGYPWMAQSEHTTTSMMSPTLAEERAWSMDRSLHGGTSRPPIHQLTPTGTHTQT